MTTAPHGSRRAGFSFAPGVFRGLFAVCLICHFNAPVRRFNYGRCPYISPALCALYALFMALWRGVATSAVHCRFAVCCQLAAIVRRPCALGGVAGPSMLAVASGGGAPLCQSRCHSCRESCKSRWHSRSLLCKSRYESRQCLRQSRYESRSLYPKIIVVYKIPCINAGFSLPNFPELTESRVKVARFRLILHQSRWLQCTCAGAAQGSAPQSAADSASKPSPACPPCRNSSSHGSNMQGNSASRKPQVLRQKST